MKKIRELPNLSPADIKAIRKRQGVSQKNFAFWLNVSRKTVSEWERGLKKPSGAALLLLTIVQYRGLNALIYFGGVSRAYWMSDKLTLAVTNHLKSKD